MLSCKFAAYFQNTFSKEYLQMAAFEINSILFVNITNNHFHSFEFHKTTWSYYKDSVGILISPVVYETWCVNVTHDSKSNMYFLK